MDMSPTIRKRIQTLLESQKLAVLSTQCESGPYASLVAFTGRSDLKHLYFATAKTTRKFSNIEKDARVAFLINSSTNDESDFHNAIAVTVMGVAKELISPERERAAGFYLEKHPYLEDFIKSPTCAVMEVTATAYYMVQNFQNVMELHIEP